MRHRVRHRRHRPRTLVHSQPPRRWWRVTRCVFANPVPVITAVGAVLTCSVSNASYQWFFNNNLLAGATQQTYTAQYNGNYAVSVIDTKGCSGNSISFPVSWIIITYDVLAYPVPSNGKVIVTSKYIKGAARLKLYSAAGALVMDKQISDLSVKNEIDIRSLSRGVYELNVFTDNGVFVKKIERN